MADKEATVYIVDVGRSMRKQHQGRDVSDLEWSMRYVWDKIATTVSTSRKTAGVGVLALGTDGTNNELGDEEGYKHISVLQPISQILMPDLRRLLEVIKPSNTDERDAVSGLILGIQMILKHCRQLKFIKKVVLVTNATGRTDLDPGNAADIVKKIQNDSIELVVIGVDFDDPEYGFKEEDKPPLKRKNEEFLRDMTEKCNGTFGTMQEAIDELATPRIKTVRSTATYRGQLRLGDPGQYDTALCIDVERYARVKVQKPPSASAFVPKAEGLSQLENQAGSQASGSNMAPVRNVYNYQIQDPSGEGGKRDIDRDDLAKGYEYGRTAVHISESDENITKLETEQGMEVMGFVEREKVERYILLGESNVIVPLKTSDKAGLALSSLIRALFLNESCAVVRVVSKDMAEPLVKILSPEITTDYECLIENELPYAEDVRAYRFPPLDKIVTVSGKILKQHRNLPSDDLLSAMSQYVDSMDLSTFDRDDEDNPSEHMALEDTYSPLLHRIEQAKRFRAIHPREPVPAIPEILTKYAHPPEDLTLGAKPALQRLMQAADVKKVPPRVKGRKRNREMDKPLSGLNVDDLFRKEKRQKISPENAVPEFKQALSMAEEHEQIEDAVRQMTVIIQDQIRQSFGDSNYDRAVEGLSTMRQELFELEEPKLYNDMLEDLKAKILAGDLNGDRKEMWWFIRKSRIGLIDQGVSGKSDVTQEEAGAFLRPA